MYQASYKKKKKKTTRRRSLILSTVVLFYTYRIPILELEAGLMNLPYIAEAYVIAAPDHEARELPAAIVRLQNPPGGLASEDETQVSLQKIRNDLSSFLASHKLPALLRILRDGEVVPHTAGGKPIKQGLLQRFFKIAEFVPPGYSKPDVEYWGSQQNQVSSETRPWDWCGLQNS